MLPIASDILVAELTQARNILDKWVASIQAGIPVVDIPSDEIALERFLRNFCGELQLCAGKCENLSEILIGAFS